MERRALLGTKDIAELAEQVLGAPEASLL